MGWQKWHVWVETDDSYDIDYWGDYFSTTPGVTDYEWLDGEND